jgi:hypothetical protein
MEPENMALHIFRRSLVIWYIFISNQIAYYTVTITVAIASPKNNTLRPIVILNRVFSIPLLAEKTPPVSAPVKPPKPAPLLCRITLAIKAIEVIISPIFKYVDTKTSRICRQIHHGGDFC